VGQPAPAEDISGLVQRIRDRERRAVAQALTETERQSPRGRAILAALRDNLGRALVVGFTGPPGAGKSTLVNAYIGELRGAGRTVAVIAVDPSSPVSGGAILGDRIRMTAAQEDDHVFVRSLAARGHLGGLSPAAVRMIDVLDAAGYELIILETVGTGQSEVDVAEIADVRIVVAAPGLGDGIQAMKSGLLEIADVLVVNKADREGAEQTAQQLINAMSLRAGGRVPVLRTIATTGEGAPALAEIIASVGEGRRGVPALDRRRRRARYLIARAAAELIAERIRTGDAGAIAQLADAVLEGTCTPADAARTLIAESGQVSSG
jgi:LAO/AO transport system kinase